MHITSASTDIIAKKSMPVARSFSVVSNVPPVQPATRHVRTCLVAGWTGGTFDTTENDLATGIDFFAMISVDAEVMCIVKTAFVIPVAEPVQPDFF